MRMIMTCCRMRYYSGLFVASVRRRHSIPRMHLVIAERQNSYWHVDEWVL